MIQLGGYWPNLLPGTHTCCLIAIMTQLNIAVLKEGEGRKDEEMEKEEFEASAMRCENL